MSAKRSHSDIIIHNIPGISLEQVDMGTTIDDDYEKIRDLKRPRLTIEPDLDELENNLCLSCVLL